MTTASFFLRIRRKLTALRTTRRVVIIAGAIVIAMSVTATRYGRSFVELGVMRGGQIWQQLSWRVELAARKAKGGVPDLSWPELWQMMRRQGGFGLAAVVRYGQSLNGSVTNPYVTGGDVQTGARLFREHCAACHGLTGTGWHGPPLNRPGFKHGDSNLAIYKILRDGIPDSPMAPAALSFSERWQVLRYLKTLQTDELVGTDEASSLDINVSSERLRAAGRRSDEWLTYSGSIDGQRFAPAAEITPINVSQLRVRWIHQFETKERLVEATPLVVDGAIFITEPPSNVVALDAKSGHVIWRYNRSISPDLPVCCGRVNRGLAILNNVLYLGSLDGYLVAINANTGSVIWQVKVANSSDGYTITGAPLIVNRSIIVGVAGGEYAIRGFLAAYDVETGRQQWRFDTIPSPGEPGHETWENDAWQTGGGSTWATGSYDPSLDLLYWGVGNPSPDFAADVRPGDNLFTDSVIALHAGSGKLAWHFQFTPHDDHDWDSAQTPILADVSINGVRRRVICWANRNGFYYVLDRTTGQFLAGVPFVEQNWAVGLDSAGRPIRSEMSVSDFGRVTKPGVGGGTNWQNAAYDHRSGSIFVHATEGSSVFTKSSSPNRGERGMYVGSAGSATEPVTPVVRALDAATGTRKWEHFLRPPNEVTLGFSGLLATAGGLLLGASGGSVFALDSATGEELWRVFLGGTTRAAPISFTVGGQQVIAVSAGRALFVFGL